MRALLTVLATVCILGVLVLLQLYRSAVAEVRWLRRQLERAHEAARQSRYDREQPGCQTRCDRDCSRFDDCKGEAWVCLNLFELLEADSAPVLNGEHSRHMGCHPPLGRATRQAVRQLIRQYAAAASDVEEGRVSATAPLPRGAALSERSRAFQADAEALIQRPGFGRRRVPHDLWSRSVARGASLHELAGEMARGECQPTGLPLPHLARARFHNASWWTFATRNLQQDALLFLLDLSFEQRAAFHQLTWLGVPLAQVCMQVLTTALSWLGVPLAQACARRHASAHHGARSPSPPSSSRTRSTPSRSRRCSCSSGRCSSSRRARSKAALPPSSPPS